MIIVVSPEATPEDLDHIIARIEETGRQAHISSGTERTIIGVIGPDAPELQDMFETMPHVESVHRVTKPYKLVSRDFHPGDSVIEARPGVTVGGRELAVMAGPCSIESEDHIVETAKAVKAAGANILRGGAYKPRSSPYAFRGLGEEALRYLSVASKETGMPVITELMSVRDIDAVCRHADIIQIGARNMQNFMLLDEVGKVKKPVMLKRALSGQIEEWLLAAEYIMAQGNPHVILCERGIRTFETAYRNTFDVNAIPLVKELSHLPVIADPSHGTGKWGLVKPVAMGSIAAGADGLMIEVHPNPDHALSDGAQSLTYERFADMMRSVAGIAAAVERSLPGVKAAAAAR
ncbi:MAG: 3-deoxy-7-phosphoheptulonate synthase [Dehalococcoidia bacterium]|nr:MAG: 3-deoxy-7-phosphoheptulonate synthase [bacterium]MCE7928510.1 3-deoxy-7-phosphoheptulonate synthase [Chloroflexi bacterium CFX7]MCK6564399.1 3-deoxy-7-phosphoheptulonate synthase [Dehalococcoidia bacterium]MCL4231823.1 3-deoxy-7-phosphoheptulonate synthase [Dehalococcoidia bacterium]NUQ54313.1 3-deoxy-7-phosphoheptulonate synthase [Dehalococcoidia bacterium]